MAAVVGDAGIGKSRLVAALRADAEVRAVVATRSGDPGELGWLEGRSRSFDNAVPYATFADMLRRWWGLADMPADALWEPIERAVAATLGRSDPDSAALLANLLGATLPAEHATLLARLPTPILHERTTAAVLGYLQAEATRRPALLVLEDLHWGDALSLALTAQLLDMTAAVPLALLLVMRPYRDDPSWRLVDAAAGATVLELAPLPEGAAVQLVDELLGAGANGDVVQRVVEHANGNPLFVEELVRSFADGGLENEERLHVPATLNGLLTARLDMLDESSRFVAQVASVVGREFGLPAVAALVDGDQLPIDALVANLVREGVLVELRAGTQARFGFRHALIQETAYGTVLLRTRRDLHARAARHLEASQPDAVQEIARHLLGAGDTDRAFPYLIDAGAKATRAMALADAIRLFATALEAVPGEADPQLVLRAHDGLGEAYSLIPDLPHATATFQRLLDYGRASDRPSIQVTALNRLGMAAALHARDMTQAEHHLTEARRIAEAAGDDEGLAEYHINACILASLQGRMELALHHDEVTATLGSSTGSADVRLVGLWRRAVNLLLLTQYDDGAAALADAVAVARDQGATETLAMLNSYAAGLLALRNGDVAGANAALLAGVPTLDRFASFHAPIVRSLAAFTTLELGDPEGAIAQASAARRVAQQQRLASADGTAAACLAAAYAVCGFTEPIAQLRADAEDSLSLPLGELQASTTWSLLGWMELARGRHQQADADLAEGLAVSSTTSYVERPSLLLGRAFAAIAAGGDGADAARALLDEAETYVAERGIHLHDATIAWCAGLVAAAEADLPRAEAALDRAQRLAKDGGRALLERDIAAAQATLARAAGRDGAAAQHRDRAQRIATAIADTIADEALRNAFLQRSTAVVV